MHTDSPKPDLPKPKKNYVTTRRLTEPELFERASQLIEERFQRGDAYCEPKAVKDFLQYKLAHKDREVFSIMLLDSQHRLIEYREMFAGTINAAPVYIREIIKAVVQTNAAAVICSHNHPSGVPEPSRADISVTERLKKALDLIDVTLLDHIVVGETTVSFAERGLL
ncbi:RadC family protein [Idiomarina sp.]|uniref:RadC family protein n=1 Tax=Idiomarina sp. TaxID=1874361 RepID=UPI003A8D9E0D